jgi:hypothetical protein
MIKGVGSTPPTPQRAREIKDWSAHFVSRLRRHHLALLHRSTSKGERPRTPPSHHFSSSLHPCLHLSTSELDFKISQLLTMTTVRTTKKSRVEEVAAASQEPSAIENGSTDRISSLSDAILSSIISMSQEPFGFYRSSA